MSVDSIGNFLTVIRNAIMVSKTSLTAPYSKINQAIAQILKSEGFIRDFSLESRDDRPGKQLKILLKYVDGESVIHEITRLSRPGRRLYRAINNVKPVIGGLGIAIISTNRGIMTDKQARQLNVGGELLCQLW